MKQKGNERDLRSINNINTTAPNFCKTCIDSEKSFRTNPFIRKQIRPTRSTYQILDNQMNEISQQSKSLR